jgi:hypothetical protein
MHVDFIVHVDPTDTGAYERDYPYQAIQVHKLNQYPNPPFIVEKTFKNVFKKAIKEYGLTNIEYRTSLLVPQRLLREIAQFNKLQNVPMIARNK